MEGFTDLMEYLTIRLYNANEIIQL
jgi:hypothetical protein